MAEDPNDDRDTRCRVPFVGPHILRAPLHDLLTDELPPDLQASIGRLRNETERRIAAEEAKARRRSIRKSVSDAIFYAVVVAFGAWIVSMVADRAPPTETKVEIITPQVRPGEDLKMRVEPNRHRLCEAKIIFRVYDKDGKHHQHGGDSGLGDAGRRSRLRTSPSSGLSGSRATRCRACTSTTPGCASSASIDARSTSSISSGRSPRSRPTCPSRSSRKQLGEDVCRPSSLRGKRGGRAGLPSR